jgi:TolB-like protein/Tfp pilus assembly protein PilF
MIGQTVSHYLVLEELEGHGMGAVYKATDTGLGRPVALKFLPEDLARDPRALESFRREAGAASTLIHPAICTVYGIDSHEGRPFIVTEFLAGETLERRLGGGPLALETLLEIAIQVADALEAAHLKGVMHGHLRPASIVLTDQGSAKVLDFGLARVDRGQGFPASSESTRSRPQPAREAVTESGAVVGTSQYMSPEQARGEAVDTRSDLFSLGAVLYELATGQPPFRGSTLAAAVDAILSRTPAPPVRLRLDLPPELGAIIEKALERDRRLRYQHASEMRADLQRLKQAAAPERPSPPEAARSRPKRVRVPAAALGGVALAVALGVWYGAGGRLPRSWPVPPAWSRAEAPVGETAAVRLAVLPFRNLTGGADQEYVSDGLTEEIIADLGRIRDLGVIARTTMMKYKQSDKGAGQIGRELQVGYVLEGAVRHSERRLRVSAQLIRVSDETHLWAESYDRQMADLLDVQSDVARSVAEQIRLRLPAPGSARSADPEAHLAYLNGRYRWNLRTEEGLRGSLVYFEQAVQKDPRFAHAYSGLADGYLLLGYYGYLSIADARAGARQAVEKALALDDALAEAHASRGAILENYDWNFAGAEAEYRRAIELNPNYVTGLQWYGLYLLERQRFEEAEAVMRRARDLDPLSPLILSNVADCEFFSRRYDRAILQYRAILEREPGHAFSLLGLGRAYRQKGSYDEAIAALGKAREASAADPVMLAHLAYALVQAGQRGRVEVIRDRLRADYRRGGPFAYAMAIVGAGLGERDEAISWLEQVYAERHPQGLWMKVDPELESLRSDPRYQALVRSTGL